MTSLVFLNVPLPGRRLQRNRWEGACRVLKQHRTTQRHIPRGKEDEERLVGDMIEFARQYGRYGYRRVAALLRSTGWHVNDKRPSCLMNEAAPV